MFDILRSIILNMCPMCVLDPNVGSCRTCIVVPIFDFR